MNASPPKRKVLQWFPSPRRRVTVHIALAFCTVFGLFKIFSIPWMWQYIDQIYLNLLFVAVLTLMLVLIGLDMRMVYPPGYCQSCGYDLTGNESGVCPECGVALPKQTKPTDVRSI